MSQRLYYLADGTLRTVSSGRFRGDDVAHEKLVTEHIVIQDGGAPVYIDPDNPAGPLVVHYNSGAGQKGVSVIDDNTNTTVFEVDQSGFVLSSKGMSSTSIDVATAVIGDLDVDGEVTGDAIDLGAWVPDTSTDPVPTENTLVARNAATETVSVSNLRVGRRTAQPKSYDGSGALVNDSQGKYAGDGVEMGLYFEQAVFNDVLRAVPPLGGTDKGGCFLAQSADDDRLYRLGFDPEGDSDNDGLHFTDTRVSSANPRQIQLTMGDQGELLPMGTFESTNAHVEICNGAMGLQVKTGDFRAPTGQFNVLQATSIGTGLSMNTSDGVTRALIKDGALQTTNLQALTTSGLRFKNDGGTTIVSVADDEITLQDSQAAVIFSARADGFEVMSQVPQFTHSVILQDGASVYGDLDMNGNLVKNAGGHHSTSAAVGDASMFIGSAKYSYDRTGHVVTLHRLKTNHIPAYLAGRGITAQNLTKNIDLYTAAEWVELGRSVLSENIHLSDVFPAANTGDWLELDAPVPTLQTWATGADADITTLETEMDAAEVRLTTLEAGGGG